MEIYYYYSEMGCVKIGNDDFDIWLLNGKGEGTYWITLCERNENKLAEGYEYIANISGKEIKLYDSEKDIRIIKELKEGKYSIYRKKGNILVIAMSENH